MRQTVLLLLILSVISISCAVQRPSTVEEKQYEKALVNYDDFAKLVIDVKAIRAKRLISLDQMLAMQKNSKTIILDTRSKEKYEMKHVKGAINLPFTEFSQAALEKIIPNGSTRIIIYCNNNFKGDQLAFVSKSYNPKVKISKSNSSKEILLALNVPTYVTLYGYGYRNIYELDELVHVRDPRIVFEGISVLTLETQSH